MERNPLSAFIGRSASCAVLAFAAAQSWAAPTSLEVTGLLFDGSGNRITAAPYMIFTEGIYNAASGGTLLADLGTEHVQVNNGSFLQVFGMDDAVFESTTYLQVNLNGFDMGPRLGIFFNGTNFFANGVTSGPASTPIFVLYTGLATPVPEPASGALLLGGLGLVGALAVRRQRMAR